MQEHWESYMKPIDGYPATVSFNAETLDSSLDGEFAYAGFVKVFLNHPKDNGLIDLNEEIEIAFIEDRLELESLRYKVGKYVGRIITQGSVNFIYYLKYDFEWSYVSADAMKHFPDYRYEFGSRTDVEWEVYKKLLYPTSKEWQIIYNHLTCKRLQEAGDNLRLKRAIEHKIYFQTAANRELYKELIQKEGFRIQKEIEPTDKISMYGLQFYRMDAPYYYEIDELTLFIINNSEKYGGEYDGWETSVVKV